MRIFFSWVDRYYWLWLALASPLLLFPNPTRLPAILIVPAVWLVSIFCRRKPLTKTPLNLAFLLLAMMVLVSLYATYDMVTSLPKICGMVFGFGVFYAISRASQTARGWQLSLLAFLGVGLGIAVFGLFGMIWAEKIGVLTALKSHIPLRLTGLPGAENGIQPNEVAGALSWVLPLTIVLDVILLQRFKELSQKLLPLILVGLLLTLSVIVGAVFILTQSRSGYIGLAIALSLMLFGVLLRRGKLWSLGGVVLLCLFMSVIIWKSQLWLIFQPRSAETRFVSPIYSLSSLEGRFEVWSRAVYGIEDFPFTGMGMNTFRDVVHILYPLSHTSAVEDIGHAHNEILQSALDLGVPGMIAFLAINICAFCMIYKMMRYPAMSLKVLGRNSERSSSFGINTHDLALGLAGGLLAHFIYGITDTIALGAKPGILFWMLLALIFGLFAQVENSKEVEHFSHQ